jgi:hypothetical protein
MKPRGRLAGLLTLMVLASPAGATEIAGGKGQWLFSKSRAELKRHVDYLRAVIDGSRFPAPVRQKALAHLQDAEQLGLRRPTARTAEWKVVDDPNEEGWELLEVSHGEQRFRVGVRKEAWSLAGGGQSPEDRGQGLRFGVGANEETVKAIPEPRDYLGALARQLAREGQFRFVFKSEVVPYPAAFLHMTPDKDPDGQPVGFYKLLDAQGTQLSFKPSVFKGVLDFMRYQNEWVSQWQNLPPREPGFDWSRGW